MNATPVTQSNQQDVYTGRTTSWSMVASTSLGALLIVVMSRGAGDTWTDFTFLVPLFLVAVGVIANVLTASSVRATAGPNGFTIRWAAVAALRGSSERSQLD